MDQEAKQKGINSELTFEALEQTNQKLASNPKLSEHNKQVLTDFFRKARSGGAGDATLRDYASRFNKLAEVVDFDLDNPNQRDLEKIVADFNSDNIRKNNGEKYSDYSKDKFWSTLSKFYRGFIKKEGKGYNEDIDGPELLEDLVIKADTSVEVDPDTLPTPEEVKKVAKQADNLRDKAIVLFGWSTGARIGEVFETQYDKEPLTWSDLEFRDDRIWVALDGKTGEREVPIRTAKPVMEDYWDSCDADQDDPVFRKKNNTNLCPECGEPVKLKGGKSAYKDREYDCPDCGWEGSIQEVDKEKRPLTDNAVRRIIEKLVERADLGGEFNVNPHDFFRKSRAIYKTRIGNTEHQLRAFFGWSETSDAPKHYIALAKEDLEKALAEEFGETVEYDNGYDEDALKPIECVSCSTVNSATRDLCKECSNPLTEQGMKLTKEESSQGLRKTLLDKVDKDDMDPQEFEELLDKPMIEVMKSLS